MDKLESEINKRDYAISTLCEQFNQVATVPVAIVSILSRRYNLQDIWSIFQKLCDRPVDEGKLGALLDSYTKKTVDDDDENPFIVST